MPSPTIDQLVEVAAVETVVRLDGRPGRLSELVLTADVSGALSAVLEARAGDAGAAFFLVGHFGSGKSHLLAALAEQAGPGHDVPAGWGAALRDAAARARPAVAVAVPLVEHRATAQLEDLVVNAAWKALGRPAPSRGTDRRAAFDAVLAGAGTGLVILLDELSEYLRAKQGPALVEDLRFLQFLGEWARESPVVVVAALQESIDEVANVSQRELARIRDRYRTLALSMRHVEDLVRGRLVRLRPGAEAWVERAHREIEVAFPGWGVTLDRLARCYPLHPATLSVLEGLRFLFSQQRGVVDFICRQLRGDATAGILPWAQRGYLELLTPDRVYDHFRPRLHERIETRRLADTVVPYYERAVEEIFDAPSDRALGLRAVKLLCLLAASPVERPRSASELADLLLTRLSALDPSANVAYLERAILEPLVARGAYVVDRAGPPRVFTVELDADAAEVALARQAQARAELSPDDRRAVRTLVELGSSPTLPLRLLADIGPARREFLWQNTLRSMLVVPVRVPELAEADVAKLVAQARSLGAEGCLLVAEPETDDVDIVHMARTLASSGERVTIWAPQPFAAEALDVALELHSRRLVLEQARAEGRTEPGGLVEFLERSAAGDEARARETLQRAYFSGVVASGHRAAEVDLPSQAGLPFERLLLSLADPLLSRLHPLHRDVAPRGELVGERLLRQLVLEVLTQPRITAAAAERGQLRSLLAGYLVPLGLVRRRGDVHVLSPDPVRSPAVAEVLRLVPDADPIPAVDVVVKLAEGPVGLTEPEALLVLNACVQAGLVEMRRGRRVLEDPFLAVTSADRLAAAELLEPAGRDALAGLGPIVGQGPWEPWNATLQRAAWERARAWLDARREDVAQVRSGLEAMADNALLADVVTEPVVSDVAPVDDLVSAVDTKLTAVLGLRRLITAVGDAEAILLASRRVAAVARFFREEAAKVEQAASYLTHPQLELPDDGRLRVLRDEARTLIRDALRLAAEDRVRELLEMEREFRRVYVATYKTEHDRFYAGPAVAQADGVRSTPAYAALAALAGIGAIAVDDDRVKVDRILAAAAPPPCHRRLDLELSWKPRCSCGFTIGQSPPAFDAAAVTATAERGVRQHLGQLQRPEDRVRLEQALDHLADLGRHETAADLRALLGLVADPATADPLAVAHLLAGPLGAVVADVLTGGHLVVRRDFAGLRDDLAGRRFPKRRLLELLAAWVDPDNSLPAGGFVEVVDTAGPDLPEVPGTPAGRAPGGGGATAQFLSRRFPRLAALLPTERAGECFWLGAWWAAQAADADPPGWLPGPLLDERALLSAAADAATGDLGARAELAELDARIGPESLLGDQVAAALRLADRPASAVADVLAGERLLRHPLRLAADDLARRMAGDWRLSERLSDLDPGKLAAAHALVGASELAPLGFVLRAAGHLAELERRLPASSCRDLVEDIYPSCWSPVPALLSRAELSVIGPSLLSVEALEAVRLAAARTLGAADEAYRKHADAGFPGCLRIWEVGASVVAPLLAVHDRVAVLIVDAMRVDVWGRLRASLVEALPGRPLREAWAVVPEPTRTREGMAALYLGRPVAAGSGPDSPADLGPPFQPLGFESTALVGADRDGSAAALRDLWAQGTRIAVAVATGVDESLHRSSADVASLVDEAVAGLERRVVPTLHALPAGVPLVVLADHGFRENRSWGRGPGSRYGHGGLSLEESVIPVATFGVAGDSEPEPPG
ncbi:MAG: DUF6079 family protein [Acidimicrobiales bacterium]